MTILTLLGMPLLAQAPPDTSQAVAYDDGITWSWEGKVEPLNLIEFMKTLPYGEEREIDELTLRRLFEWLVEEAKRRMQIEGDGGDFETTLRRYVLYFTPEVEYYWPPYEEDFSKRVVKFPIKVEKRKTLDSGEDTLVIHLGRYGDNERDMVIYMNEGGIDINIWRKKYIPEVAGPPIIENIYFTAANEYHIAALARQYFTEVMEEYTPLEVLKRYRFGNTEPEIDNTKDEPALDLSGVGILFQLPYDKWRIWGAALLQTYRSLINLCKLQLNLIDNGYELEKILWRDFFRFDRGADYFGIYSESANARRESTADPDREVFKFRVGNVETARTIYLTLNKKFAPPGYEWGIEQITLSRPIVVKGAIGEEVRELEFVYGPDNLLYLDYTLSQFDNGGYTILNKTLAFFEYNNPYNLIEADK